MRAPPLPEFHSQTARRRLQGKLRTDLPVRASPGTPRQVALFATCYGNRNEPELVQDLAAVFEHNGIGRGADGRGSLLRQCPSWSWATLKSVDEFKRTNIPELLRLIDAPATTWSRPSRRACSMLKQELPLMFRRRCAGQACGRAHLRSVRIPDVARTRPDLLRTDFSGRLGKISYHVPCHLRVQNIGLKTAMYCDLVPDTNGRGDRALLGSQRHLCGQERISRLPR